MATATLARSSRAALRIFPSGFHDAEYLELERDYEWQAHERWMAVLAPGTFRSLLRQGHYSEIAAHAVAVESRTNLLSPLRRWRCGTRYVRRPVLVDLPPASMPSSSLLRFARQVRRDTRDLGPRDMIDLQSFLWVLGSEEYEE